MYTLKIIEGLNELYLSVPLNAHATNKPGSPGNAPRISITKYGMS